MKTISLQPQPSATSEAEHPMSSSSAKSSNSNTEHHHQSPSPSSSIEEPIDITAKIAFETEWEAAFDLILHETESRNCTNAAVRKWELIARDGAAVVVKAHPPCRDPIEKEKVALQNPSTTQKVPMPMQESNQAVQVVEPLPQNRKRKRQESPSGRAGSRKKKR